MTQKQDFIELLLIVWLYMTMLTSSGCLLGRRHFCAVYSFIFIIVASFSQKKILKNYTQKLFLKSKNV